MHNFVLTPNQSRSANCVFWGRHVGSKLDIFVIHLLHAFDITDWWGFAIDSWLIYAESFMPTKKIWIKRHLILGQFILFWSNGAVFYSIMSSIYIIYHNSSHSTWSKPMKIPMHIEFAWNVQFLTVYAFGQHLGSIWAAFGQYFSIVKSYWKENMVCIRSPSKLPTCIKFWWEKMNS